MPKLTYSKDISETIQYARPVARVNSTPLDESGFFPTYAEAVTYAKTNNSYVGQLISVIENIGTAAAPVYRTESYVVTQEVTGQIYIDGLLTDVHLKPAGGIENGAGKVKLVYDDILDAVKFVFI